MSALLVTLGAAVGALLRHVAQQLTHVRAGSRVPWGTLLVNLVGSFTLGLLLGAAASHPVHDDVVLALGTGVLGAFTTYSALALETVTLGEDGHRATALAYLVGTVVGGLALAAGGLLLGHALLG